MKTIVSIIISLFFSFQLSAQVSYQRIANAENEPGNWFTYSGNYAATRFSPLQQITTSNVQKLAPVWIYQLRNPQGPFETTPIVVDKVMYISEPPSTVTALDVATGRKIWTYTPDMPKDVKFLGFGPVNRGVAILDNNVYVGTLDAHLICLDAKSGALKWNVVVGDNKLGYAITCAPVAIDGKIIIGISGGEAGIRGFLDAYNAKTGKREWRLYTIPGTGETGNDTWQGDSWKTGGAPTWVPGSYDKELNLLYWGIGNPGPDWNGDKRNGDNLYTCSVLAINPTTGKLVWHFQFTPHDTHDWDANQIPVLIDVKINGVVRKALATANRNGFYYLLDRKTGEFLAGKAYAKQTWAKGLDAKGKPIIIPGKEPTEKGNLVYPSLQGATNWFSPSYSKTSGMFYVSVREMGSLYFKQEAEYKPGQYFMGGGEQLLPGDNAYGAVKALDPATGAIKWEFRLQSPPWSGLLSTAGGLVFGGSVEGNFYALDAVTGKSKWQFQTGGQIVSNPMSFSVNGQQRIAIAAGSSLMVFGLMQ
ncbi:PQQ-dependent dehydrogenase, methanol/ethanol family [Panacibacter ginsenosidivorans]|uniref:PQQ-dependent dehydrogenase, methanol/ethanol family n=1 Tax=Panacibacter ginsenosidivorans TaxID=1813871 RepID=A0A5B8V7E9_9BACT|nr:PQQ-dependent dehydrogenase, methanol/ethanol family [Panacibacter ginsenosidivorans]QEC66616.1 PQQ-dependent dehydrogenase, methanol/ethanol family [Panacibacter ginsenosidivorans]